MHDAGSAAPRLLTVAAKTPDCGIEQSDAAQVARAIFAKSPHPIDRLISVFDNAGIRRRSFAVPVDWFDQPRGWRERNELFVDRATDLLRDVAAAALETTDLRPTDIDALVVVSTTGVATPSLDAQLLNRLPFRPDVRRLPIFGLGCAGGVIGLSRCADLATSLASRGDRVRCMFLAVELCSLTFRRQDLSKSNIVASALFADGACAAIIECGGDNGRPAVARLGRSGEHTWPESLDVMGWRVEDDGLGVLFSRDIPSLVRRDAKPAIDAFLQRAGIHESDLAGLICHPGGAKVLGAFNELYPQHASSLAIAAEVLADCGNMSAVTVMFVLKRMIDRGMIDGPCLMTALGPGFSLGIQMVEPC